ncbi:mitogen-activated protein kinase 15 [Spatholobus suberectus]|nr:mitogen-activated protein kinase 15 [Spatholobus suberectus]
MSGCRKVLKNVGNWLAHKNKDEWLKDMRGMLSLVATVIATMTFQSALNPPGGVRPANDRDEDVQCPHKLSDTNPCPGQAVLAVVYPDDYTTFLLSNTICFVSSLAVCLLLVSGLPLNHRFFTWLFSIGMCITLTGLTLTYMFGAQMVTPDLIWSTTTSMFNKVIYIWISLLGLVTFVLCLRLIVWIVTKCIDKCKGRDPI